METNRKKVREKWLANRFDLEKTRRKRQRKRGYLPRFWKLFDALIHVFGELLKLAGLYNKAHQRALDIRIRNVELRFPCLPVAFDGYRILHLTDLHLDIVPGFEDIIIKKIKNTDADICILSGDYRKDTSGHFKQVIRPMEKLVQAINAPDGIFATLGNHDTYLMMKPMSQTGINIITNETLRIEKDHQHIYITGVDDVHYYFSPAALDCLKEEINGFKIAVVHSPELYDVAAENNYDLYLCGHTHAGQICLPGGKPLITHLMNGKRFYRGLWKSGEMTGYTGSGTGTSGIPVRINTESEITLFTLKCCS